MGAKGNGLSAAEIHHRIRSESWTAVYKASVSRSIQDILYIFHLISPLFQLKPNRARDWKYVPSFLINRACFDFTPTINLSFPWLKWNPRQPSPKFRNVDRKIIWRDYLAFLLWHSFVKERQHFIWYCEFKKNKSKIIQVKNSLMWVSSR